MATNLCPPTVQSEASCNAILVESMKDWDEYQWKCLRKAALAPPISVVIEEIIKSPADSGSLDLEKRQALPTIGSSCL